jgi:uncharacterized protein (TIGR03086 family)
MNLAFTALMSDEAPPERGIDRLGADPAGAFNESASKLITAFQQPDVLERTYHGSLGDATGADRLQIRLYDLLAHGWDLARATGQTLKVPDEIVERSLAFVTIQIHSQSRAGRFNDAQTIADDAPALERLAAFLGRCVNPS